MSSSQSTTQTIDQEIPTNSVYSEVPTNISRYNWNSYMVALLAVILCHNTSFTPLKRVENYTFSSVEKNNQAIRSKTSVHGEVDFVENCSLDQVYEAPMYDINDVL